MPYNAWFQCAKGCENRYPLTQVIYECPRCEGLLEVRHDMDALRTKSPVYWQQLFDRRYMRTDWPYGSSVWGKKEVVCPEVDNDNVVSTFEGGSNLFWADRLGQQIGVEDLWVKQCGNSHTGSFKDLGMTVLVSTVKQMIAEGQQIPAVACASTGDTSAALASYCAAAGIQAVVFLPRQKVTEAQLVQPMANGALVLSLDTDFDGCMKLVQDLCHQENIYLANSMNSLRVEGQKTIGIELLQQFDWERLDWIVIPGGNLGNVSALGKGLLELQEMGLVDHLPRILVAQAARANPLYLSYQKGFEDFEPIQAEKTLASAIQIGDPVSVEKAITTLKRFDGVVEQATEQELADAVARADRTGLFCCPHTGVAFAALLKLLDRGAVGKDDRVVVISTAHGLKFTDFKVQYHRGELQDLGVDSGLANMPVELPAEYDAVRDQLYRRLEG
ncbi:MAG: threonine synthase [Candidatus Latescibacteria bacterium]|jgi:threonine synthase|nr:threonine synthase [Candidatus Latescibacterota bacterium]